MPNELQESRERLESSGVSIAVYPDGRAKEHRTGQPWPDGSAVYTPEDMIQYVLAPEKTRLLMRKLKGLSTGPQETS